MVQNLPGNQNPQTASPNETTTYKKKYFFQLQNIPVRKQSLFTERKVLSHKKAIQVTDYMFFHSHLNYSEALGNSQIIPERKVLRIYKREKL